MYALFVLVGNTMYDSIQSIFYYFCLSFVCAFSATLGFVSGIWVSLSIADKIDGDYEEKIQASPDFQYQIQEDKKEYKNPLFCRIRFSSKHNFIHIIWFVAGVIVLWWFFARQIGSPHF